MRRRKRTGRRTKSTCSSKQIISSYSFHVRSPRISMAQKDETAEKGETDSFYKESTFSDKEEKEAEIPCKQSTSTKSSYCHSHGHKSRKKCFTEQVDQDKRLNITHSLTIHHFGQSESKIIVQQSHETAAGQTVNSVIAVTTSKKKGVISDMTLDIREVTDSDDLEIKTILLVQREKGKKAETGFQSEENKMSNKESSARHYSKSQCGGYRQDSKHHENVSYEVSLAELKKDAKDLASTPSSVSSPKEMDCCKTCCKDHFCRHYTSCHAETDFTLVDGSSTRSSLSDFWFPRKQLSLPNSLSNEVWDIPPPLEFADKKSDVLQGLTENLASCHLSDDVFKERGASQHCPTAADDTSWYKKCKCSLDEGKRACEPSCCSQLHDVGTEEHLLYRAPTTNDLPPAGRSSFTNFIQNHEGRIIRHNNSVGIIDTNIKETSFTDGPRKRRRTFPGVTYRLGEEQDSIHSRGESVSSGTLSSFLMQSLASQTDSTARFYADDDLDVFFDGESRKSSSSSSYKPSSWAAVGHDTAVPNIRTNNITKNPIYTTRSSETPKEMCSKNGHEQVESSEVGKAVYGVKGERESSSAEPLEQSEVNESGFDEEMAEVDECGPAGLAGDVHQKNLLIHILPPSPSHSEELVSEGVSIPQTCKGKEVGSSAKEQRDSVIATGKSYDRRVLHSGSVSSSKDLLQRYKSASDTGTCSGMYEPPSVSPTTQQEVREQDPYRKDYQQCCHVLSNSSSDKCTETTKGTANKGGFSEYAGDASAKEMSNYEKASQSQASGSIKVWSHTNKRPDTKSTHQPSKSYLPYLQITPKASPEVKEHLKTPVNRTHSEEIADHWVKKRKLFKKRKHWSSKALELSTTNNITDESDTMNSEDTGSMDVSLRDVEDRGFYTETFHSASWIYRGDETAQCLNHTRPAAVRERTVKINKRMGEYPWGFRLQFSKPVIVTEVDTNSAAEEAGLRVGDHVLAVNGTDVTSVQCSEAADLAQQGPDVLTLTLGSDIGCTPNTPRPACRGYLHKRTQSGLLKGWRKRWFVLKHDCWLYYYRNKRDEGKSRALSAMKLDGAVVQADGSLGKPFVFKCWPVSRNRVYYFCATSSQEMRRWLEAMDRAVHPCAQNHVWVDVTRHNSNLPPLAVKNPECLGLLHLQDRNKDSWVQRYCILKDGCLYFYAGIRSTHAVGGIYLHGYTVKEHTLGFKKSTIELKPPSEEFKVFHLCAENPSENRRWIAAIKTSVGKWLLLHQAIQDYMSCPLEETRM
ncbi:uncharacterized protein pdzph1 isoform X2 [Brachyhypopomus gauderio]|uniref:uncharacterized protein pdzph1 isoform X2 n=1 Tax=Brachyhypopomus gauderio TaxID=698409 RepID=UPI004041FDC7